MKAQALHPALTSPLQSPSSFQSKAGTPAKVALQRDAFTPSAPPAAQQREGKHMVLMMLVGVALGALLSTNASKEKIQALITKVGQAFDLHPTDETAKKHQKAKTAAGKPEAPKGDAVVLPEAVANTPVPEDVQKQVDTVAEDEVPAYLHALSERYKPTADHKKPDTQEQAAVEKATEAAEAEATTEKTVNAAPTPV